MAAESGSHTCSNGPSALSPRTSTGTVDHVNHSGL